MLNIDKIKSKKDEIENKLKERQDIFYKFQEGDNILRFLPYKDVFYKEVYRHVVGERVYVCPKTFGSDRKCPICELVDKLRDAGDVIHASQFFPKARYYSVAVVKKDKEEEKVYVISYGNQVFLVLCSLILDPDWGDFTDPKNGYSINIKRTGEGRNTKYQVIPRKKVSVPKNIYDEWLSKAPNLDEIFKEPTYESLLEALEGVSEDYDLDTGEEIPF